MHGRHLVDRADETRATPLELGARERHVGTSRTISPSASPVVVATPKRTVATYAFGASSRNCANLVASPKHERQQARRERIERAGVARLLGAERRFACCSAAFDDRPAGLSSSSTPSTRRREPRSARRAAPQEFGLRSAATASSISCDRRMPRSIDSS